MAKKAAKKTAKKTPATSRAKSAAIPAAGPDRYRRMIETIKDYAITMIDPEGVILSWNPGAEAIKGYKADEIIGQHFSRFYPKEAIDRDWPDQELKLALANGRVEDQGWRVRKDGTQFWANVVITPLRDAAGKHIGFAKVTRDLTERKQLDEAVAAERARAQAILNATADGLITIDERGTVLSINGTAERLFGWRAEELLGHNVKVIMPSPYHEEHDGYLANYVRTGVAKIIGREREVIGKRKDDTTFPVALRVTELNDRGERIFIGTVQDITDRKRNHDRIRDAIFRLSTSGAEILASTNQQTAGAQAQAAAVSEIVTSIDEVAQTAEHSAQRARSVGDVVQRAQEHGTEGRKVVENSTVAMGIVQEQVETTAENILSLAEQAQAISEIIATVSDIADQTNLLALNAAIEASRAGEHGRGFAVVATEVKALADQSKKATAQVRQILGEIQKATNKAVLSTEEVTKGVAAATDVAAQAGETIRILADSLTDAARAASQIVASAGQQAIGMGQIQQAMKNIDHVTRQNLVSTREVEESAKDLDVLGTQLSSLIDK